MGLLSFLAQRAHSPNALSSESVESAWWHIYPLLAYWPFPERPITYDTTKSFVLLVSYSHFHPPR